MNHEHTNFTNTPSPRHRAEGYPGESELEPERDTTADAYIAAVVAGAPTAEAGRVIARTYARYGTAFAHYLALEGVDKYARDDEPDHTPVGPSSIEASFKDVYYGCFPNREALVADTIASFDWGTDLDRLLAGHPDLRAMLVFDHDAIWGFVNDHYEIVDGHDGLYVFERWP